MNDSTTPPTFTPVDNPPPAGNRIAQGISGNCSPSCSYTDTGRITGQVYYYIVQARDTTNTKIDTNNTGNRLAKFSAPTNIMPSSMPFALENFEAASANTRFAPPLVDETNPNTATAVWQRVINADLLVERLSLAPTAAMYAPDFDPTNDGTGAPSDIQTQIGPLTLSSSSILEFNSRFATEFAFDGGNLELKLGAPFVAGDATPFPDNAVTFDMNYFIIDNGYSGKLDGTLAGPVILSALQGRYSFTGVRGTSQIRAALGSFAPGGVHNPGGAPVYLRFRQTSDAGTSPGANSGWYIDNLVINNFLAPTAATVPISGQVKRADGVGLRAVSVSLFDTASGETFYAMTNANGVYQFNDVPVGEDYIVTPLAIGYSFNPTNRFFSLTGELTDVDFTVTRNRKLRRRF